MHKDRERERVCVSAKAFLHSGGRKKTDRVDRGERDVQRGMRLRENTCAALRNQRERERWKLGP